VFLVNSRYLLFLVTNYSPPSPEVTELFCRVPSIIFFHYLCIFYSLTCVGFYTLKITILFLVLFKNLKSTTLLMSKHLKKSNNSILFEHTIFIFF